MQHEQDPLQRLPVRQSLPTRIAKPSLHLRQKRLDQLPQLVRDDPRRSSHRHPSQLDDRCRRPSPSQHGSLHHSERSSKARRVALLLLASAPLIVLAWAAAALGSHLGARHALPWQWQASPAWRLTLLVAAAALVIGLFAATAAVAASGRLTRWLPDYTRLAATSAITAGIAAAAVDLILLLLLARQLAHAPATLDATPVTIAALASITRLAFAQRSIRHSRPLQTTPTG
jgi:hypothetical protein